ncbi:MAG: D-alanyl-D-alanine carboxypeptidase, partial [Solobacterium sp.]|nr:D-alanyl-D-alanine carboxypeptidase [Solobacterium sp.]
PMEELDLHCDYVYLIDPDTGQTLIDRRSEEQMYPASLTKVMTSIIAIEEIPDPENVTIEFTQEMLNGLIAANANRAGFLPGDEPTALDHIYGDLLPSGADCSRALAFYIAGDEEAFVELMNEKAAELGMHDTHFVNTSGLHDDDHYTTCRDMMTLYLYCMKNETFMDILKTQVHTSVPVLHFPDGLGMTNFVLMYINQADPQYQNYEIPGFIAGKSGYTIEGQYTLVSNAEINGMNLVMVNGHGYVEPHYPASIEDSATVYNWYREHFARQTPVEEGQVFGTVRVINAFGGVSEAVAAESFTSDLPSDENLHLYVDLPETVNAPLQAGDKVGTVSIYSYDQLVKTIDLVVNENRSANLFRKIQSGLYNYTNGRLWLGVILIVLILASLICMVILLLMIRAQNRRRRYRRRRK